MDAIIAHLDNMKAKDALHNLIADDSTLGEVAHKAFSSVLENYFETGATVEKNKENPKDVNSEGDEKRKVENSSIGNTDNDYLKSFSKTQIPKNMNQDLGLIKPKRKATKKSIPPKKGGGRKQ